MAAKRNILVSIIFRVVVCALVLLVAGLILRYMVKTRPQPTASDDHGSAPRVVVMQAQPVPVQRQWEGFGTAAAMDAANVPARVTATVVEKPQDVRPGRAVQQGQLLVRLDESDFARQVEIAQQAITDIDAQLARIEVEHKSWSQRAELAAEDVRLARADHQRIKQAFETQAATQRELDEAQRRLNTAQQAEVAAREEFDKIAPRRAGLRAQRQSQEASLRLANQNVERSRIVSPLDGILQTVDIDVGESVMAGQRVVRVVSVSRIEVPLLLPAAARPHVTVGDEVTLTDAGPLTLVWKAQITRISPEDDQTTRTMRVYVELRQHPEGQAVLAPGKFVQGTVVSGQPQNRWMVPRRALEGQRIRLIEDGFIRSRDVLIDFQVQAQVPDLGLPDTQWAVLTHPLPANALVVVDGSRTLAEGNPAVPVLARELAAGGKTVSQNPDGPPSGAPVFTQESTP